MFRTRGKEVPGGCRVPGSTFGPKLRAGLQCWQTAPSAAIDPVAKTDREAEIHLKLGESARVRYAR